jgi:hypothetical protein
VPDIASCHILVDKSAYELSYIREIPSSIVADVDYKPLCTGEYGKHIVESRIGYGSGK